MTRLHLVRHGPTHATGMVGWTDLPADLSDAEAVARLCAHLPSPALLVSSDLSRAVATADALARGRRRLPHREALRELHFGDWELRRHAEIAAEDPERLSAFWSRPGEVRAPGGESWGEMRARSDAAIDALITAHARQDLVIVVHFGVILGQLQRALGLPAREVIGQRIDNLSVTEIVHRRGGWVVGRVNHRP